jgi:hypothetical protein
VGFVGRAPVAEMRVRVEGEDGVLSIFRLHSRVNGIDGCCQYARKASVWRQNIE